MSKQLDEARRQIVEQAEYAEGYEASDHHLLKSIAYSLLGILECMERSEKRAKRRDDEDDARSEREFNTELYKPA